MRNVVRRVFPRYPVLGIALVSLLVIEGGAVAARIANLKSVEVSKPTVSACRQGGMDGLRQKLIARGMKPAEADRQIRERSTRFAELKLRVKAAVETRRQNIANGMGKEAADTAFRNDVAGITTSNPCEEECMSAWQECMISGRPQAECDAEFATCMVPCNDAPIDPDPNG